MSGPQLEQNVFCVWFWTFFGLFKPVWGQEASLWTGNSLLSSERLKYLGQFNQNRVIYCRCNSCWVSGYGSAESIFLYNWQDMFGHLKPLLWPRGQFVLLESPLGSLKPYFGSFNENNVVDYQCRKLFAWLWTFFGQFRLLLWWRDTLFSKNSWAPKIS